MDVNCLLFTIGKLITQTNDVCNNLAVFANKYAWVCLFVCIFVVVVCCFCFCCVFLGGGGGKGDGRR